MLLGHSGVGKSTLVNRLVPEADRATGDVSGVGKGRHTSSQSVALPLEGSGWVIDTPGIRSFGLAHIEPDDVLLAFSDLAEAIKDCPRGCGHLGPPADPECALDTLTGPAAGRVAAARRLLAALREARNAGPRLTEEIVDWADIAICTESSTPGALPTSGRAPWRVDQPGRAGVGVPDTVYCASGFLGCRRQCIRRW